MSKTEKHIELNRKTSDLFAGILCSGFSIVGITIMDKSELITWVTIVFFGIGAILLLLRYFNPNSGFLPKQKEYYKKLTDEEFMELYNSNGIFTYHKNGFELQIEDKPTKIEWNEIKKLTAYKVDLFATDEIRLFLEAENGKQFEISESTEGWFQFNERLKEQFSEINKNWEIDIAVPAFERKETEIYNRIKNVG
ncbi:hypothetical protein FHS04_002851 [Mesoflavibacter sabulilitoris]|uniref:hypothetical protein n=1 Tax=Mesoflavibacter zeaxanthinifaciens TaxID=393060 RepID=UPI0011B28368|nr:hypothetical protein [Mesoflavibacter zeaxanthinifaciens]MBB3125307.1 hypothetical protein [Mesoflavibacter zeaxanthinifaciens subsp. sabulilitoris]